MSPDFPRTPSGSNSCDPTPSSSAGRRRPPPIRLPPLSPTDSAISFDSPRPRKPGKPVIQEPQSSTPSSRWLPIVHRYSSTHRWILAFLCIAIATHFWLRPQPTIPSAWLDDSPFLRPSTSSRPASHHHDPLQWLAENLHDKHALIHTDGTPKRTAAGTLSSRPRAALISLVRNSELTGILQSMRQLELRWNHKYAYPWIFFSEVPFTAEFMAATTNATASPTFYELIPAEHWSVPAWIDEERYMTSLAYLDHLGVGKGYMLSYHAMCRWNSGFFYRHPALAEYDFYWRVEPDVHFFCDIDYDVFRLMRDCGLKYGFNMNILDDARSFPSLWSQTREFMGSHPELVHEEAEMEWLVDEGTGEYNNCQFFSNFEIGDLNFFRGKANEAYFAHLDARGGFYYERFGDAPIHTLSAAMFLAKREMWFFRDVGYQHDIARHCPPQLGSGRCDCEPTGLDENFYKLVPMESPQRKPRDTCLRAWLGGEWVEKRSGWSMQAERAFGGDGYHGYVRDGM